VREVKGEFISLPQEKVLYGPGSLERLPGEVKRLDCHRVLIITGRSLAEETPVVRRVEDLLADVHAGTFTGIRQHVPESGIQEAVEQARQLQADLLVSVGGGSPIDAAKAVARGLATEQAAAFLPHIAIPTTLSAAEYSHVAGYTDETRRMKTGFADVRATPRVVILEPELTLHTPLWLWSSSGIRALDHAVETLYSPGVHPVNDLLALNAIADLFEFLPRCQEQPHDLEARHRCQMAAWMSYFAPASVSAHKGLSHTIGKRIGTTYGVPHGITSCILMPHVMRFKARREAARLAPIAHALNLVDGKVSEMEAALASAGAVASLIERLELPSRLRDVDVPQEALEQVAQVGATDDASQAEIMAILERAW